MKNDFTEEERWLISDVFQNYYGQGLYDIAADDSVARSMFCKVGLMKEVEITVTKENDNEGNV